MARQLMMLCNSKDSRVVEANIGVKTTSTKWSAVKAVNEAESILQHIDKVGLVTEGRGLGNQKQPLKKDSNITNRSVQNEIRHIEVEEQKIRNKGSSNETTKP